MKICKSLRLQNLSLLSGFVHLCRRLFRKVGKSLELGTIVKSLPIFDTDTETKKPCHFKARLHRRFLSRRSCNFNIARVNQLLFQRDIIATISQEFRTCSKLDTICRDFWLKCDNHESEGPLREVLSLAICTAMSGNKDKKRTKNQVWSYPEEECLIQLWPKYTCLYQTSSKDYKRSDKKAAAMEQIRRSLKEQFTEEPFPFKFLFVLVSSPFQSVKYSFVYINPVFWRALVLTNSAILKF